MNWSQKIFVYCERGADASFWAEPLNAVSNGAFIAAALAAGLTLAARHDRATRGAEWGLVAVTAVIGIGSFLFHTYATRWAVLADVLPIGVFMLAYSVFALRRYVGTPWPVTAAGFCLFVASLYAARGWSYCPTGLLPVTEAAGRSCLNGSIAYLPALGALVVISAVTLILRRPGARLICAATAVFAASLTFRSLDFELCGTTFIAGRLVGMHIVWHLLNAATLYLLLLAAIEHGVPITTVEKSKRYGR